MSWREFLQTRRGKLAVVFCLTTLFMMLFYMSAYYRDIIGPKKGILLNDPVLNFLTPVDWSVPVFFILFGAIFQTVIPAFRKPLILLTGLTAYCAINIIRMFSMYLVTLEPPSDMILLIDPFSAYFAYPDRGFAKDLFFSGHISTMMILVFVERNRLAKTLKIIGSALMGLFLAWQHVHYTVDLVVAPVITYWVFMKVEILIQGAGKGAESKPETKKTA